MKVNLPRQHGPMRATPCVHCGGAGYVVRVNPTWLRSTRERAGISLREMARRIGVSAPYVCDVEHGRRAVPDSWRAEYAKVIK